MINDILNKLAGYTNSNDEELYKIIIIDDFLPTDRAIGLENECMNIPNKEWRQFTRRGSNMLECNNLDISPKAKQLVEDFHNQAVMIEISKLLGLDDIRYDPHLIGAGYSKSYNGDSLKIHTDFNWNDTIQMYRAASFIIYLNQAWEDNFGGHLEFRDTDNNKILHKISPKFNRAVIWKHHHLGFHGFPDPIVCPQSLSRNTFRLFFYQTTPLYQEDAEPHRSLYWYDEEKKKPYDIKTHR